MKQAFLTACKDNSDDNQDEDEETNEPLSLFAMTEGDNQQTWPDGDPNCPLPFTRQHFDWWKDIMEIFLQAEDFDLWMIVNHGFFVPTKIDNEGKKVSKA